MTQVYSFSKRSSWLVLVSFILSLTLMGELCSARRASPRFYRAVYSGLIGKIDGIFDYIKDRESQHKAMLTEIKKTLDSTMVHSSHHKDWTKQVYQKINVLKDSRQQVKHISGDLQHWESLEVYKMVAPSGGVYGKPGEINKRGASLIRVYLEARIWIIKKYILDKVQQYHHMKNIVNVINNISSFEDYDKQWSKEIKEEFKTLEVSILPILEKIKSQQESNTKMPLITSKDQSTATTSFQSLNTSASSDTQLSIHDLDTQLIEAIKESNTSSIKELIARGENVNSEDKHGWTPLHYAASPSVTLLHVHDSSAMIGISNGSVDVAKILIEAGAKIDAQNSKKSTALHLAIKNHFTDLVNYLVTKGARLNIRDDAGMTPIYYAAGRGYVDMVTLLLKFDADIHIKDFKNRTVLDLAESKLNPKVATYPEIISLLKVALQKKIDNKKSIEKVAIVDEIKPVTTTSVQNSKRHANVEPPVESKPSVYLPSTHPRISHDFIIDYNELTVESKIGSGGFGDVYKGQWTGQDVAIKKLHMTNMSKDSENEFKHETSIWKKLTHPNIVSLFGICIKPDPYCMVMRYKPSGSLYKLLHDVTKKISWISRKQLAKDIASALLYLHTKKPSILHRDLKSLNILVSKEDDQLRASLTDFGLSEVKQETATTTKIGAQNSSGTLLWMAPELLRGRSCSKASDIYAYGMVLWELVTRKQPFKGVHSGAIRGLIKDGDLDCLEIPTGTPLEISNLIKQCWNLKSNLRPSAQQILDKLNEGQSTLDSMPSAKLLKTSLVEAFKSQSAKLTDSNSSIGMHTSRKIKKKLTVLKRLLDQTYSEDDDLDEDDIAFRNTTITFINSFYGKTKLTSDEKKALADKKIELLDELDSDDEEVLGTIGGARLLGTGKS